jgi:cytochrome P450
VNLPAGPSTSSWLQLIRWIADPLGFMESCRDRYGDIFTARLGEAIPPFVFVSDPQAIREIFSADPGLFDSGRSNGILEVLVGKKSLFLMDGANHQRQRRLLTPPFHGDRMRAYGETICQIAAQVSDRWSQDKPFCVRKSMQEITMGVILQAVFGLQDGSRYQELKQLLGEVLDMTGSPLSASLLFFESLRQDWGAWSPWGRVVRRQQQVDKLLYSEIRERRQQANTNRSDILSLMMAARDENGEGMTDVELRDDLMSLLVAGHETTATALAWAFYWIQSRPDVREQVLAELDGLGNNPTPMDIARLPYLTAVCQETLRIYPVAMLTFARIANTPFTLGGREFAADTMLAPCIYLMHHREDLFPQPKQFKPERFLERQFANYEYFPFGGSTRVCIGMALAMFEMKLVLATILSRYDLALAQPRPPKPQRRGLTLAPDKVSLRVAGQRQPLGQPVAVSVR